MRREAVDVDGLTISWLEEGEGLPVLLVHGWPTSALLWRRVIPAIARHRRVLAIDLPGFGQSSKPLDVPYTYAFYHRVLDGFAARVGLDRFGLAVHDLGGPVGLSWAATRPRAVERLAILNTIVYPDFDLAVRAFLLAARLPGAQALLTSRRGLRGALRFGTDRATHLDEETCEGVCAPFADADARTALIRSVHHLGPEGLEPVVTWLRGLRVPLRVIWGTGDWILPTMGRTAARLQRDVPHAEVTALPGCAHFLQEDRPDEVGALLAEFFGRAGQGAGSSST